MLAKWHSRCSIFGWRTRGLSGVCIAKTTKISVFRPRSRQNAMRSAARDISRPICRSTRRESEIFVRSAVSRSMEVRRFVYSQKKNTAYDKYNGTDSVVSIGLPQFFSISEFAQENTTEENVFYQI